MTSHIDNQEFIIPLNSLNNSPFHISLIDQLMNIGASVLLLPQSQYLSSKIGDSVPEKYIFTDHLDGEPTRNLSYLVEKYSIESPRSFIFPQLVYDYQYPKPSGGRFLPDGPTAPNYDPYLKRFHLLLESLDILYEGGFKGIPLQNQGGEINRRALAQVAEYHGVPSVRCSFNPIPDRSTLRNGESMSFPEIESAFDRTLTDKEVDRAKQYQKRMTQDSSQVVASKNSLNRSSLISNILGKAQRVWDMRVDSFPVIWQWLRKTIGKPLQAKAQRLWSLDPELTQRYMEKEQFIFYSIQYYRESRVTMRSPAFYDQARLIKHLSRSVPHDNDLLIKDHPQQLGAMPLLDIRQISRYATLADPFFSSHRIIKNSEAVVTLNNTVGHEAIVFGKPVVALGSALYSDLGGVVTPDNINDLDAAISNAVDDGGLSDSEIQQYINALFEISEPVTWGDPSRENVSNFISAINRHLNVHNQ